MTPNNTTNTYTGKFIFVTGLSGGREVFLGRSIDEPFNDYLTVEGKPITWGTQGQLIIRPFVTRTNFAVNNPNFQIQVITSQEVVTELTNVFKSSINNITRWTYPLTYRWIESAMQGCGYGTNYNTFNGWTSRNLYNTTNWQTQNTPFTTFFTGFQNSVEQFRRALFTSPQVNTTTEMDKITELEGNLAIGFGKVTNNIAIKFNNLVSRETELTHYFEWLQAYNMPYTGTNYMAGWFYLNQRMQIAKSWARRYGKAPLVREVNNMFKEAVKTLNEILLDHCSTLDTLVTETCSQYGIPFELYGEMSPFGDYNTAYTGKSENYSFETAAGTNPYSHVPVGV
jgi:hypothetical protein